MQHIQQSVLQCLSTWCEHKSTWRQCLHNDLTIMMICSNEWKTEIPQLSEFDGGRCFGYLDTENHCICNQRVEVNSWTLAEPQSDLLKCCNVLLADQTCLPLNICEMWLYHARRSTKAANRFENTCAAGRVERGTSDCHPGPAEQCPELVTAMHADCRSVAATHFINLLIS